MQSGEKIEKWIKETLSRPHETFNNLPACPFAKKAWLENKVEIHEDRNLYEIDFKRLLTGELDVIMFLLEPTIDVDEFDRQVNLTKAVVKDKYIVLDDHPQHEEKVSGFKLNLKDIYFFCKTASGEKSCLVQYLNMFLSSIDNLPL